MNTYLKLLVILLAFFINSCSSEKAVEKMVDKERDEFSREFVQQIIDGDTNLIYKIDSTLFDRNSMENLNYIYSILYHKPVNSVKIIGLHYNFATENHKKYYTINYEYKLRNNYALISVTSKEIGNKLMIIGFNFDIKETAYTESVKFSFKNKSVIHYIIFLLIIAIPLFIIYSLIRMFKSNICYKWLWAILIILLNFSVIYNWHTGTFFWNKISLQLLGIGISQGDISAPWDFAISLPLGAIIFWIRLQKLKREEKEYQELAEMYDENDA